MIVFRNVLKRIFGKKLNVVFMLIIPIVLNIFIAAFATKDMSYSIGVVDEDQTKCTEQMIKYLKSGADVTILDPEDDYKNKILNDGMECVFYIHSGFTNDLLEGKKVSVDSFSLDTSNIARPIQINMASYVTSLEQLIKKSNYDETEFYSAVEGLTKERVKSDYLYSATSTNSCSDVTHISLGYIAFCMVFLMTFSTALIMEDKEIGIYDRILTSPISAGSYYVQHLLSYLVISVIQIVVVIAVLPLVTVVDFGGIVSSLQIILICSVFSMFCIALGMLINKLCKNAMMVGAVSSIVNMPLLILGGCFLPKEMMPKVVQKIGNFVPTSWFLDASDVVIYGRPFGESVKYIMYMMALIVVILMLIFIQKKKKA